MKENLFRGVEDLKVKGRNDEFVEETIDQRRHSSLNICVRYWRLGYHMTHMLLYQGLWLLGLA